MEQERKGRSRAVDLNSRPQVGAVARGLTRLIHAEGLLAGDSLPSQARLRERQGFHNNTLNPAMQLLVDGGVIRREARSGTVVVDPARPVPGLWRVGLGAPRVIVEQMFYAQLFHLLQVHLQAAGATPRLFIAGDNFPDLGVGFRHLPDLPEACAGGQLDGFITSLRIDAEDWQGWHARGLEMVHVGAWEDAPAGVVIEQGRMVTEAVGLLRERGCDRLAVVGTGPHQPGFDHYWHAFRQVCAEAGLDGGSARELHGGLGPAGGWRVADQLLDMPESDRPDGLIVLDDRIATGLTAVLAPNRARYCPQIVVQTNLQAPLAFALPVIHYEVDVEELARRAVGMLMARLRNPQTEPRREWLNPERHSDEPVYMIRNKTMDVAHNTKEAIA